MNQHWSQFRQRWAEFILITVDPWVLLLLLAMVGIIVYSVNQAGQEGQGTLGNAAAKTMLAILVSLSSLLAGVVGAMVAKRWSDLQEGRLLVVRGRAAIRSLTLLRACPVFSIVQMPEG